MKVQSTELPDVKLILPKRHHDERGFFSEVYNKRALAAEGIHIDFVQDNHSSSVRRGTLRGLHFQSPPFAQTKLVRVLRGAALDVAVDIRHGAPTFGRHVMVELTGQNGLQILIPQGFAHGVLTLLPDTELLYKVDAHYAPEHDRGVRWDDPDLGIPWPLPREEVILSPKDSGLPLLSEIPSYFGHV
jgi:dTDP-4-dehydrorhamnose 3,5-epimerase